MTIGNTHVLKEFRQLAEKVRRLKPEYTVGGFLKGKKFGDVELLWDLADRPGDYDVIRLYREGDRGGESFDVSYYRGTHLIPGEDVVRRFIGRVVGEFRADTVDAKSGELLERQGSDAPHLTGREETILEEWHIAQQ